MKLQLFYNDTNPFLPEPLYCIIDDDLHWDEDCVCSLKKENGELAKLFVAAPEMLELLRAAQTFLNVSAGAEPLYNKINELLDKLK